MRRSEFAGPILWLSALLGSLALGPPAEGQTAPAVTVAQLRQFLQSREAAKTSDKAVTARLNAVTLSERLTKGSLSGLLERVALGPRATEQLQLLAASSSLLPLPAAEIFQSPPPDPIASREMIAAALRFATGTIQHLPDFVAVRATRSYDNLPQASANRHVKPKVELHWTGFTHREITYRDGHELLQAADNSTAQPGFSTWGEFGPMLTIVLTDAFQGSVTWDHWERDDAGARVAVFHYTVPRSASHYSIDFCCYQESLESPWQSFREKPGYHGAITLRPDTGEITRITLDAEMKHTDAVRSSGAALDYGSVEIGGRTYQCPVRSVALSVIYSPSIEKINGEGLERHINEVAFTNYHKFGSSVRIVPAAP